MEIIDLRSDTITKPSAEMRRVMAEAQVGDDVYGEDPTVNELERMSAEMFGKEGAIYVPSGSMANQVAIMSHTRHGDSVVIGVGAHNYFYESGAAGALAGIQFNIVGADGLFAADDVEKALNPPDHHFAPTRLVCIENTHNRSGGRVFPFRDIEEISARCRFWGIPLHCDGARIFNASAATGISVKEYAAKFDSISFCLSKGLGCPVGSVLMGSADFRDRAHRYRKMLGGGMRQAGILAAAGIYALNNNIERLKEDHKNAKILAEGLAKNPGFDIDLNHVESNIVKVGISDEKINAYKFVFKAADMGVKLTTRDKRSCRAVAHMDVTTDQVHKAVDILGKALGETA